ncbi:MAG: OmpA family protein [Deltaproteobacteria bacterium]|nr:OmpA family protein [Deltaproteobacteria bacterium]
MARKNLYTVFFILISFLLAGCAAQQVQPTQAPFSPHKFKTDQYQPKVDNFIIIFDASTSMMDKYNGQKKLDYARDIVSRMNRTIPDFKFAGALRTFGQGKCLPGDSTSKIYGLTAYSEAGLEQALNKIKCVGGITPMGTALNAATGDLKPAQGKIAAIIVGDGKDTGTGPVQVAGKMKKQFGDRLCIYTVLIGNDPGGKAVMEQIAKACQCGFSVNADQIASSGDMANFVEKVFLTKVPKKVAAPPPAAPAAPPAPAKPGDSDGDGVYDDVDSCPNTPSGAWVDSSGCWVLPTVLFETDKWNIDPYYYSMLDGVSEVLKRNPDLKMQVQGHTDSMGGTKHNQRLSENRAGIVMEYLIKKGVEKNRLSTIGYASTSPVASNLTPEGMTQNRRTELVPTRY